MLIPDKDGIFTCDNSKDCGFETDDLFEMLDHQGVEYTWGIRLSYKHNFDMFQFLRSVNENISDPNELFGLVQSALMLFINASRDELEDFIMESTVVTESDRMISSLEKMLEKNSD